MTLQALFQRKAIEAHQSDVLSKPHRELVRDYAQLDREYRALSQRYEELRRPFSVTVNVPYTDVWKFPAVQHYPGKHPCEKPAAMMAHIISASSRPGDVVADFFMGSGSTIKQAVKL